jgi:hypothetical protein
VAHFPHHHRLLLIEVKRFWIDKISQNHQNLIFALWRDHSKIHMSSFFILNQDRRTVLQVFFLTVKTASNAKNSAWIFSQKIFHT